MFLCSISQYLLPLFLGAALCLAPWSLSAQPANAPSDYDKSLVAATEAYQAGNLDEARATLQSLLRTADGFPSTEPNAALVRSFLAMVEADRGRFDNATQLHVDAINLMRITDAADANTTGSSELSLCLLRQGEYLHARNNRPGAQRALQEVLTIEEKKTADRNAGFTARARWALAESFKQEKNWASAGRFAYFARQDVRQLYGPSTDNQIKMIQLMVEASINLGQGAYAAVLLEEYRALLVELGAPADAEYPRLKQQYEAFAAKEAETSLLAARKRAGVLQALTTNPLTAGQVGYAITRPEQEVLDKNFTLEPLTTTAAGAKLKFGPHRVNDAALSLLSENGFLYKAVVGITLDSPQSTPEALHPALVDLATILFDPNELQAQEFLLQAMNASKDSLAFRNSFALDDKRINVSRDESNNMAIIEFFPN